jgi:CxxC motif-containing protein (DUF1111 family)
VPETETIRTLRAVLNTLGDGFVEAVGDQTFLAIAASQPLQTNGMIHGEAIQVAILEAPGRTGVGKFGWKDQDPTILSFSGDAYLNEMGVTNRLKPKDVTTVCKVTTDPWRKQKPKERAAIRSQPALESMEAQRATKTLGSSQNRIKPNA